MNINEHAEFDAVALGEVMLRLDPGEGRIHTARTFQAVEGGGEYNVVRGLSRCFGLNTAIITSLVDNPVGRLVEGFMLAGGVDVSQVVWRPFDGMGKVRNGLNFTERGFGVRGALGVSDRAHTAIAALRADEIDADDLFGRRGVRLLHTGGIYSALSDESAATALAMMARAKESGTVISYDLNYRPSLWRGREGKAQELNRQLARYVDVMIGNEEDFGACLGLHASTSLTGLDASAYERVVVAAHEHFDNLEVIATTMRDVHCASRNDWSALAWSRETGVIESVKRQNLDILDRVGGGDSFASGLLYGLLSKSGLATALEYGAAHGALAMTTPGDTSMATKAEVIKLAQGGSARVDR